MDSYQLAVEQALVPEVAVAVVIQDGGGLGQSGQSNRIPAPIGKAVMEAVLSR